MRIFDLESGNVKILCPFNEQGAPIPLQWTKDGAYILGEINNPKSNMLSIVLVNAEKGSIQTIKTLPDNKNRKGILKASISDDNRYILYDDLNEGNKKDLNIIGVDGKLDAIYLERPIRQTMILFGSMITGVFCL